MRLCEINSWSTTDVALFEGLDSVPDDVVANLAVSQKLRKQLLKSMKMPVQLLAVCVCVCVCVCVRVYVCVCVEYYTDHGHLQCTHNNILYCTIPQ